MALGRVFRVALEIGASAGAEAASGGGTKVVAVGTFSRGTAGALAAAEAVSRGGCAVPSDGAASAPESPPSAE
jgi:hypothetical protein